MALVHEHIQFHNVAELEPVTGLAGRRLQRFPAVVRAHLGFKSHTRGRFYAHRATGCELRFVTDGRFVRVTLSAIEADATAFVYRGDLAHSRHELKAGVTTTLFLEEPPFFSQVETSSLRALRFAPAVWRVAFNQDAIVHYHHIEAFDHALRPPRADELPTRTWLAFGSSITFGGNALLASNTYVQQAARRLGVDALNLGLPGSCLCEPTTADYLAQRADWHFATLELGVNLTELATPAEVEERVRHLLATVAHANPAKPIFVIDIFPNRADAALDRASPSAQNTARFRQIVRRAVTELASPHVRHLDARAILPDFTGLSSDLLHPSDEGHLAMGERLAVLLSAHLSP